MRAETNFTCQVIFVYLYSTLQLIVLSTIPYRYDRFVKTDKQKHIDKEKTLEEVAFLKFKIKLTRPKTLGFGERPVSERRHFLKEAIQEVNKIGSDWFRIIKVFSANWHFINW